MSIENREKFDFLPGETGLTPAAEQVIVGQAPCQTSLTIPKGGLSTTFDRQIWAHLRQWSRKEDDLMEIGKKLRQARLGAGLTQEQAAGRLFVPRQTI